MTNNNNNNDDFLNGDEDIILVKDKQGKFMKFNFDFAKKNY